MLTWKVLQIKDNGAGQWYRWSVQGVIFDGDRAPREFIWAVPDVTTNPAWDITEAKWLT